MITKFDTPELARKRFEELKEKHNGWTLGSTGFCLYLRDIDRFNIAHSVTVFYNLLNDAIEVTCHVDQLSIFLRQ